MEKLFGLEMNTIATCLGSSLGLVLLVLALLAAAQTPAVAASPQTSLELYRAWVEKLASKEFEGRGPNTEGIARARDMIADHFKSIGRPGYIPSAFITSRKLIPPAATRTSIS